MGAHTVTMQLPGTMKPKAVIKAVEEAQIDARGRNSDAYTGDLGTTRGVKLYPERKFKRMSEAIDFLVEEAQKWGPAAGVRVTQVTMEKPLPSGGVKKTKKVVWLILGWCAS